MISGDDINLDELIASLEAEAREEFSVKEDDGETAGDETAQSRETEKQAGAAKGIRKERTARPAGRKPTGSPSAGKTEKSKPASVRTQKTQSSLVKRQMRRRRILLTSVLVTLLVVLASAVGTLIYIKRGKSFSYLVKPYTVAVEFESGTDAKENLKADPFAKKLCVVGKDKAHEGISLPSGEKGLLLNLSTQKTLFSQNAFRQSFPASITKLVTAIMALEYGNLNETVTISEEDVNLEAYSQVCGFMPGDKLSMDQLLHCLLVYSGNDAAMAIAEHIGGTIDNFVQMMNDYATSLGCTGTHFMNPHGLQDENHYTTPYDIYLILKEAAKFPEFTEISQLSSYTVEYYRSDGTFVKTLLDSTDLYLTGEATLPKNVTILGGKTGYTNEAGYCLALICQNAYGQPFVSIVMGAVEKENLYNDMDLLLQVIND